MNEPITLLTNERNIEKMWVFHFRVREWIAEVRWINKCFWRNIRTKGNFKAIQESHQNYYSSNFKRRYHSRKEIIRNYQRDLPAIKAQQRKEINGN